MSLSNMSTELRDLHSRVIGISEDLRKMRLLSYETPVSDERRLVDIQRTVDLASEMMYVESTILKYKGLGVEIDDLDGIEKAQEKDNINFNRMVKEMETSDNPNEVFERWQEQSWKRQGKTKKKQ